MAPIMMALPPIVFRAWVFEFMFVVMDRSASKPATPEVETAQEGPKAQEDAAGPQPKEDAEPETGDSKSPERPSTLSVEPITDSPVPILSPAGSTISRRDSQLTDRGFFDVKFYHNKLW
ncbi:unnamed protein product, partial [Iphiclides podalirius]